MTRRRYTPTQRAAIFRDNDGRCYLCTRKIAAGEAWEIEHPLPVALGGSQDVKACRPAHVDCHKPKTAIDIQRIRKADRQSKAHAGVKRKGRGFQTNRDGDYIKHMDGTVSRRER